jgi:autophagy-related protein 9
MAQQNTFLSRVFGAQSQLQDTEMSSIRDDNVDGEESFGFGRAHERSLIESDEDSESEDMDESQLLHNGINESHFMDHLDSIAPNNLHVQEEEDDDVPPSLLVQGEPQHPRFEQKQQRFPAAQTLPIAQGKQLSPPQISHKKEQKNSQSQGLPDDERIRRENLGILNPKERALWKWANVENLDKFLQDVYSYYLGSGYYCILMTKFLDLSTLLFVVFFATYLSSCIDYSKLKLPDSRSLEDIKVDQCYDRIGFTGKFCLWMFYIYVGLKSIQLYIDAKDLSELQNFYNYLLEISDNDLQTISWQVIVSRIMLLKDQNAVSSNVSDAKSKSRIDAHDIANRIMRKENYYIALFNKDILDLTLPIPGFKSSTLTKTLEWNLQLCVSGLAFNEHGQVRQQLLKESSRRELAEELKKRFRLAAVFNIILSPLLVTYFILLYFFRYFNEYRKNPGSIGSRQYTPLAEWKFREFNELYHLFQRRMNLSVPVASHYVDQFPKEKTVVVLKFIAFVSGSFAAVLGILSIIDPDMFFNFEITKDRTVLFYISVFGTVWAVCHGAIPEEYIVFDSEASLHRVAEYTHYLPKSWEGRYHTEEVKAEFCDYFTLKPVLLFREITSLVMTPFILWFSLPNSADKILDFFREYSVHVDGLGYVCTFAMFDFEKSKPNKKDKQKLKKKGTYYGSGEEKMMKSYLYFLDSYGNNETQRNGAPLIRHTKASPLQQSIYSKLKPQSPEQWYDNRNNDLGQSFMLDPLQKRPGLRDRFPASDSERRLLGESFITTLPKTDVNAETEDGKNPGVLGLLNEFYKDYQISH